MSEKNKLFILELHALEKNKYLYSTVSTHGTILTVKKASKKVYINAIRSNYKRFLQESAYTDDTALDYLSMLIKYKKFHINANVFYNSKIKVEFPTGCLRF